MTDWIYNLKTDGGALGNGVKGYKVLSINNGSQALTSSTSTWAVGDIGKRISFTTPYLDTDNHIIRFLSTITGYTSPTQVTIGDTFTLASMSPSSQLLEFGTDDAAAFGAYNAFAVSKSPEPVSMFLGAGRFPIINTEAANHGFPFGGFKEGYILGNGPGNTFITNMLGYSGFHMGTASSTFPTNDPLDVGGSGVPKYGGSRTLNATAGQTGVILKVASEAARFPVGSYAMMGGFDMQGEGAPQNLFFLDYVKIASFNTSIGYVGFTTPLTNDYKAGWPCYNPGTYAGPGALDAGGPAALFPCIPSWDTDIKFQELTIEQDFIQTNFCARIARLHNVNCTGDFGILFSQQGQIFLTGTNNWSTCGSEMDKLIGTASISGLTIGTLAFQSPSCNSLTLSNSTLLSKLEGTPRVLTVSNCSIQDFKPGATSYGRTDAITMTNTNVVNLIPNSVSDNYGGAGIWNINLTSGIIKSYLYGGPIAWAVPGTNLFFDGQFENHGVPFMVTDVTTDGEAHWCQLTCNVGSNVLTADQPIFPADIIGKPIRFDYAVPADGGPGGSQYSTVIGRSSATSITLADNATSSMSGPTSGKNKNSTWGWVYTHLSINAWPTGIGGTLGVVVHPCPVWNGSGNTGCADIVNLNNTGAQGKPMFSYSKQIHTNLASHSTYTPRIWGQIQQISYNVTAAGSGDLYPMGLTPGSAVIIPDHTTARYGPVINTAQAGERLVLIGSTTGTKTGDSALDLTVPVWIAGSATPYGTTSGGATVAVEIFANQGMIAPGPRVFTVNFV